MAETFLDSGPEPDALRSGIPGPPIREHFIDAQRRNRRASWRAAAIAVPAVIAAGIPLCVLVTPLIAAPFILSGFVLNAVGVLPPALYQGLYEVAHILPTAWSALWGERELSLKLIAALLVLPGAVVMLASWLALRLVFREAWVGSAMTRLGARPATREVLEERRLMNVVEELAVAAAVATPRVAVIDSAKANAIAIGLRIDDATIIVSTGLLQRLDRAETQAFLAHLVGSIGNGDLRIAATLLSVFQSWGLLALLVDSPFSREARSGLGHVIRSFGRAVRGVAADEESRRSMDLLLDGAEQGHDGLNRYLDRVEYGHITGGTVARNLLVDLPLLLTACIVSITTRAAIGIFTMLLFGPPMAALWRSRRRLADASAIELTRQPDALASALTSLHATDVEVPGGEPISFLFPVWTPKAELRPDRADIVSHVLGLQLDPERRLGNLRRLGSTLAIDGVEKAKAEPGEQLRELLLFLGWLAIAMIGLILLAAISLAAMGGLLIALWKLFELLLISLPTTLLDLI